MPTERASNAEAFYKAQTQGSRVGTVRGDEANADLNCIKTIITLEGDEVVGNKIKLTAPMREGQVIVPALSIVVVDDDLAGLKLQIGTATNEDCIAQDLDIGSPGIWDLGSLNTDLSTVKPGEEIIASVISQSNLPSSLTKGRNITFYLVTRSI